MTERELIDYYVQLIIMSGHMGCLWWSAGTIMGMALLKFVIDHTIDKEPNTFIYGIYALVLVFFCSLIFYGVWNSFWLLKINQGILALIPVNLIVKSKVVSIIELLPWFYLWPTTTFILMGVAFIWLIRAKETK